MAAALHARCWGLVADDVTAVAVSEKTCPTVYPAFPQLKLLPESVSALGLDPESLPVVEPQVDKRAQSTVEGFPRDPLPLRRIYVLAKRRQRRIRRLGPQVAFAEMVRHSYPLVTRIMELSGGAAEHLARCGLLVSSVPVCRMSRPPSLDALAELARWVERDVFDRDDAAGGQRAGPEPLGGDGP
jgi:hypothetical protein